MKRFVSFILIMLLTVQTSFAFMGGFWTGADEYEKQKNNIISRGEACKLLIKLYNELTQKEVPIVVNPYCDVDINLQSDVVDAYALGLVGRGQNRHFYPDAPLKRSEIALMIFRIVRIINPKGDFSGGEGIYFPDEVPVWAQEALKFTFSRGITAGSNDSYEIIGADEELTVGETLDMLDKTLKGFPKYPIVHTSFQVKKAYLTFDDKISHNTEIILDVLKEKGVRATFFVSGADNMPLVLRMKEEGHTVGNHSMTHNYSKIYASEDAFWEDFYNQEAYLESALKEKPMLIRFPGGSNNTVSYKHGGRHLMQKITEEARKRGYVYTDWNVDSGDADEITAPKEKIVENVLDGARKKSTPVILMHHSMHKTTTAEALPEIIDGLLEMGFTLVPMSEHSYTPQFLK